MSSEAYYIQYIWLYNNTTWSKKQTGTGLRKAEEIQNNHDQQDANMQKEFLGPSCPSRPEFQSRYIAIGFLFFF